jgi:predicted HD superfamily hydrolase involved in NAD metabolism
VPVAKTPRYKEFLQHLRQRLPEKKVSHSIFVAEYFSSFADLIGVDHDAAATAGLLHDCCRLLGPDALVEKAREYNLPMDEFQRERPVLLHGPVGAEYCRRELGVEDEDVYEAIYWHTTGRPQLGMLGQGLYLADFAEPMRPYPEAAQTRELMRKHDFGAALLYAADAKNGFAQQKGSENADALAFQLWLRKQYA